MHKDLIYDIGMHNGENTEYYLKRGFRVIAVEANPTLVEQAAKRFAREIADGKLVVINAGIAEVEGELPFWVSEHTIWSSFDRASASRHGTAHHQVVIPCRKFRSLLEQHGTPFYMKVDIEGNDMLCLVDLTQRDLPKYVSVEATSIDLLNTLRDLGYTGFKCISQYNLVSIETPPSPEQSRLEKIQKLLYTKNGFVRLARGLGARKWLLRQITGPFTIGGHTFPIGSSGPFGDDLPGRWQTFQEMSETYRRCHQWNDEGRASLFWTDIPRSLWADFHAKRD